MKSHLFYGKENLSIQICEMEKCGVKLYGMSPVVFFIWLLTQEVEAVTIPASHIIQTAISSKDKSSGKELAENNMPAEEAFKHMAFTEVKSKIK